MADCPYLLHGYPMRTRRPHEQRDGRWGQEQHVCPVAASPYGSPQGKGTVLGREVSGSTRQRRWLHRHGAAPHLGCNLFDRIDPRVLQFATSFISARAGRQNAFSTVETQRKAEKGTSCCLNTQWCPMTGTVLEQESPPFLAVLLCCARTSSERLIRVSPSPRASGLTDSSVIMPWLAGQRSLCHPITARPWFCRGSRSKTR